MNFIDVLDSPEQLLIEGSMYDRLKRAAGDCFDPDLAYLGLIYSEKGRIALRELISEYIQCGLRTKHSMLVFTPTWRANAERTPRSQYRDKNVNDDAVQFVRQVIAENRSTQKVFVGGLTGCRNDCYQPTQGLTSVDAAEFHWPQIAALAESNIDLLFASTLPAVNEALGISRAMARTPHPYALSFVVDKSGAILDGTPLHVAIETIDNGVSRPPVGYFVNCIHPRIIYEGLESDGGSIERLGRFIGFQGNTSKRDPREFDALPELEVDSPEEFVIDTLALARKYKLKFVGGCCGTGPSHIEAIGRQMLTEKL